MKQSFSSITMIDVEGILQRQSFFLRIQDMEFVSVQHEE